MAKPSSTLNQLVSPAQLSEIVNRSRVTIWRWIKDETLPPPVKINGTVLGWKVEVLSQWLDSNVCH